MSVVQRIVECLVERQRHLRPNENVSANGYHSDGRLNLMDTIDVGRIKADFGAGAGNEMQGARPKMAALHSSSALAVNAFGPWHPDRRTLELAGRSGFETLRFEARFPILRGGTPPHIDVLAAGQSGAVAVESKFTEYFSAHVAAFRQSYERFWTRREVNGWREEMNRLRANAKTYVHLDAAQLIKHYMGLRRATELDGKPHFRAGEVTLLYLFWEPENWHDVAECVRHRQEIATFSDRVGTSEVIFAAMSYSELFACWDAASGPEWLPRHLHDLRARYALAI